PYKIKWLESLKDHAQSLVTADPDAQVALMGDWNIAPLDEDVWDIDLFLSQGHTHVSPPERAAFHAFEEAGFTDVARQYTPGPGVYTYWDYTQLRFPKKEGMRIDFVLGSPALAARVTGASIDREERKGKGASDHAPVLVDLAD
ncbi:MAG TPA: exodeoxyribonuclease III, partial [Arthrobacter sp.]